MSNVFYAMQQQPRSPFFCLIFPMPIFSSSIVTTRHAQPNPSLQRSDFILTILFTPGCVFSRYGHSDPNPFAKDHFGLPVCAASNPQCSQAYSTDKLLGICVQLWRSYSKSGSSRCHEASPRKPSGNSLGHRTHVTSPLLHKTNQMCFPDPL